MQTAMIIAKVVSNIHFTYLTAAVLSLDYFVVVVVVVVANVDPD